MTLKDIAKHFNLSISTISRALRDDNSIAYETREKIKSYAREHHFKTNSNAANLRKKQSNVIGVILPAISNHFFSSIIDGMEEVADQHNYSIIITQTNESFEKEVKSVQSLISLRVAGILISMSKETERYEHYKDILENHIPLVFFDRICTGILTDKVVINDYQSAFSAVDMLIRSGCKRIAYFGSDSQLEIAKHRRNGYMDALRHHHIKPEPELMYDCDTGECAQKITPAILQSPNRPDAFFAINDSTAAGVLNAVKRMGIRIPDEISICGFGDGYISQITDPMLTSIDQHPFDMGRQAMELIIHKIEHPTKAAQISNRIVQTKLNLRETSRPIKG